jgi:TetR/AcrR family transcriptional regulator, mexJK operon transcriptional repressor
MPPRDEQDYEQRRQQIIDGALAAFSNKGFDKASNRDIAEASKIGSPGLIYHYFKDKVDLLYQVILERMPLIAVMDQAEKMMDIPPEQALPEMAAMLLRAANQWPTAAIGRVLITESMHDPRVAHMVNKIGPGRGVRILATYLERQMDAGRLRRMDPQVATRILVGPIIAYTLTYYIFDQPEIQHVPADEMTRQTIESFLRAMAPE